MITLRKALPVEIQQVLFMALECSVYVAPTAPGLTREELLEASRRADYRTGETEDALRNHRASYQQDGPRLLPDANSSAAQLFLALSHERLPGADEPPRLGRCRRSPTPATNSHPR